MKIKSCIIVLGIIFTLILSFCKQKDKKEETVFLNHNDSVKYIGIKSCEACHADKYETFIKTGMGLSFDVAGRVKSSAVFENVLPVYDTFNNFYYYPFLKDDVFYLREYRLEGKDTVYSRTEKITYIVGSGHHTNSHFTEENGYIFQAPITFYTQKGKWDLPPGFEGGNNTRFRRKIGLECMSCHNSLPEMYAGTENRYAELPHGISCERCHGPGEIHVREKQKGIVVDVSKETDYTIVNPAKLPWQRQIDICQRCHLQGNAVLKPGKSFLSFRPGMKLSETFDQFSPEYDGDGDFVMAAHSERFQMSPCFKGSVKGDINSSDARVGFTCISCHDPHVSVRSTNNLQFNKVCSSCHNSPEHKKCTENTEKKISKADNCVLCHMPSSGTSDIPHVTVHDHYIRKPDNKPLRKGKLKGLRCITNSDPGIATETEAYVSYYEKFEQDNLFLSLAKEKSSKLDKKQLEHRIILIHLYFVQQAYSDIITLADFDYSYDSWTMYRIAKSYDNTGNKVKAIEWFEKLLESESGNLDFLLQYAVLLIRNNQEKKASDVLNNLLKLYSKNAEAWAYLGITELKMNKPAEAARHFQKALSLDPDLELALQNLKNLYSFSGNTIEASKIEKRLLLVQERNKKNKIIRSQGHSK